MNKDKVLQPNGESEIEIGMIHHVFRQKSTAPWKCVKFTKMKAPMYKFIYVIEGEYYATINGKEFVINEKDGLLLKRGENYFSKSITLPFDYIEIELVLHDKSIVGEFRDLYIFKNPEKIESIMLEMHKVWCDNEPGKFYVMKSLAYKLFAYLTNENEKLNEKYQYQRIRKSVIYIDKNYTSESIDVQALADMCEFSLSQYNRIFKSVFGTTPKKYINTKKIDKAAELLSGTNYPIWEIAELCGFSDNYYFCKIFKSYKELSPLKYRAEYFKTNL